jgi:hypothetical protein
MIYIPKYFKIFELVDPDIYRLYDKRAFEIFFDNRILWTIDQIRKYFGRPMYVNNWIYDGNLKYRGFRPFNCNIGAKFSQHRFGRAIDFDIDGMYSDEVRQEIKKNEHLDPFKFITRMETNVPWVHIDCGNYNKINGIRLFNP